MIKIMNCRSLIILMLHFLYLNSFSQHIQTKHYSISDGLVQSRVNTISQDKSGRMWFGTVEGISIYDGSSFHSITEFTHPLPSEYILCSHYDEMQDILWFGTIDNGMFGIKSDSLYKSYPNSEKTPWQRVNSIDPYNEILLISTNAGIGVFDPTEETMKVVELDIPDNRINDFALISPNRLAFGTLSGIAITDSNFTLLHWLGKNSDMANTFVHSLLAESENMLLAGTRKGISRITLGDKIHVENIYDPTVLLHPFVNVLFKSAENTIWVGSGQGIQVLAGDQLKQYRIKDYFYRSIFQDREGNIWFGARGAGVIKLRDEMFVNYTLEDGLPNQEILSIYPDQKGSVWYGTNKGLFRLSNNRIESFAINPNTFSNIISDIHEYKNDIYLATWNGVFKKEKNRFKKLVIDPDSKRYIRFSMLEVFMDKLVMCDRSSLHIFDGKKFSKISFERNYYFDEMRVLKNKDLLVIASQDKIFFLNKNFEIIKKIVLKGVQILSIIPTEGHLFYLGTDRGLAFFNGNEIVADIPGKNSLKQFEIIAGSFDNKGQLWMGTNNGLLKYNDGYMKRYTTQQGFIGDEIITNRSLSGDNYGNIHIGTFTGLSICYPDKEKINLIPPNIRITNIELHERNLSINESDVELSYSENSINFYYSGISFRDETELTYKYRLVGVDTTWSRPIRNNSIKFAKLPPGSYSFQVLAINGDGIISERPSSFRFIILAPLYLRPWFIAIAAIIIALLILLFYRRHITKIKHENIRLDQIVKKRTKQLQDEKDKLISANTRLDKRTKELSDILAELKKTQNQLVQTEKLASLGRLINGIIDEINNPLAYIFTNTYHLNQYIEQLRNFFNELNKTGPNKTQTDLLKKHDVHFIIDDLNQIIKGFETTLTKVINILENLNSYGIRSTTFQNVNIRDEIEDSIYQIKKQFPDININSKKIPENLPVIKGSGHQLGQVFQSILKNSAEMSEGTGQLELSARITDDKLYVQISDNGPGIKNDIQDKIFDPFFTTSPDPKKMGLGLAIAMSIISQHGGSITLNKKKKKGTEFIIDIPL